jgi:hypothetical protein
VRQNTSQFHLSELRTKYFFHMALHVRLKFICSVADGGQPLTERILVTSE